MQNSRIIRNTFYIQLAAYIVSELTHMIGNIVDGVIIGRCLGVDSMAAFGIVSPVMVVFALIGAIIYEIDGRGQDRRSAEGILSFVSFVDSVRHSPNDCYPALFNSDYHCLGGIW